MKKLIFLLSVILICGSILAQNKTTITQTSNTSTATVTQLGTDNTSTVDQKLLPGSVSGATSANNIATVSQTGEDNISVVSQDVKNTATQTQDGKRNEAYVTQIKGNGSRDMWSYQFQKGEDNKATVYQTRASSYGHQNLADQTQFGNWNVADIYTRMAGSTALQIQGTALSLQDYNKAYIHQNGGWMYAKQEQYGGGNNYARTVQLGPQGGYNRATLKQDGSFNGAEPTLVNISFSTSVDGNPVSQYQKNYDYNVIPNNVASMDILGSSNQTVQWQDGDENDAVLNIIGSTNQVKHIQVGDENEGTIGILGSENLAGIYSNGNLNHAFITQSSNLNTAILLQNGNSNVVNVEQKTGDNNKVNLTQDGGAEADILQDGANNTVMGLLADIMATSLNGSTLDVDQLGNGNTLHLQQTNGADATVYQDGITNTAVVIQN